MRKSWFFLSWMKNISIFWQKKRSLILISFHFQGAYLTGFYENSETVYNRYFVYYVVSCELLTISMHWNCILDRNFKSNFHHQHGTCPNCASKFNLSFNLFSYIWAVTYLKKYDRLQLLQITSNFAASNNPRTSLDNRGVIGYLKLGWGVCSKESL